MKKLLFTILITIIFATSVFSVDLLSIVRALDNNEVFDSIKYEGDMLIYITGKKYVKTFYAYAKGNNNFFMEFTNADDAGTKYMKKEGNLFVYSEDLEEVMPITGHMLRESMMGSDMSYEDAIDNDTLESQYNFKIVSEEKFGGDSKFKGRDCWVIEFTAKKKTVSYAKRMIWVDKETHAALKVELFALSGAKLKESIILNAKWIENRYFATEVQMRDLLRKNSKTVFIMKDIEIDVDIPKKMFSIRNLEN